MCVYALPLPSTERARACVYALVPSTCGVRACVCVYGAAGAKHSVCGFGETATVSHTSCLVCDGLIYDGGGLGAPTHWGSTPPIGTIAVHDGGEM